MLTDEEPRLGSWPGRCPGLKGQADEVPVTCTSEHPSFLPRSSSAVLPTAEAAGADPWGAWPSRSSPREDGIPPLSAAWVGRAVPVLHAASAAMAAAAASERAGCAGRSSASTDRPVCSSVPLFSATAGSRQKKLKPA